MSYLLQVALRLGDAAFKFRQVSPGRVIGPIISLRQAKLLRKEFAKRGLAWPFDPLPASAHVNPTALEYPKQGVKKGHVKRDERRNMRAKLIEESMAKMPTLIAEHKASKRVPWEDVTPTDRLLLSARKIKEKYLKRK